MDELTKPAEPSKDDELLREMRDNKRLAEEADDHNRKEMEDDLRFLEGHGQWPDNVRAARERDGRPCLTINKLPQFVSQVVNDIRQNRPAIRVKPVDDHADVERAKILEGLIRNIENVSRADQAYDTAAQYAVSCGLGFITVETCYADDDAFVQDIRIKRVRNPMTVFIDPNAQEADASDMGWAIVSTLMPLKQFKRKYKDVEAVSPEGSEWADWFSKDDVRLAEYWTREQAFRPIALLQDGQVLPVDKLPEGAQIVSKRNALSWKVTYHLCTGNKVLERKEWPGKYIPIVPVYGEEIDINGKVYRRGLIRYAKDPQRMYNYWRTTATELVALAPKAPALLTTKQIEGHEAEWESANASPRPYLTYNPDPASPLPQRLDHASVPQGVFTEAQVCVDDMKATTGMYDASLGARGNETSGKAILARQREGDNATFVYTDNLSRAIAQVGRIIVDLIPKIYDTTRIVRVLGEDGNAESVAINQPGLGDHRLNDLTIGKYDVVCQAGPSYATKRIEAAETMLEFVRVYPPSAPIIGDLLAKNMDWPEADKIAARMRALLPDPIKALEQEEGPQIPPEVQQMIQDGMAQMQQMAAQNQELQAKLVELEADKDIERQKLLIDQYNAETNRIKAMGGAIDPQQIALLAAQLVMDSLNNSLSDVVPPDMPDMTGLPEEAPPPQPEEIPQEPGQAPGFLLPE